jgi:uncharacterized protein DUF397
MQNGDCVEVRHTATGMDIRDSKNRTGRRLRIPPAAWVGFLLEIRESPDGSQR